MAAAARSTHDANATPTANEHQDLHQQAEGIPTAERVGEGHPPVGDEERGSCERLRRRERGPAQLDRIFHLRKYASTALIF
jgi:hypothetical protein